MLGGHRSQVTKVKDYIMYGFKKKHYRYDVSFSEEEMSIILRALLQFTCDEDLTNHRLRDLVKDLTDLVGVPDE